MAKRKQPEPRKHRWGGAGYVCVDCGCIKDTGTETPSCPGGRLSLDVWTYTTHAGWFLYEEGYDTIADACCSLEEAICKGFDGGCVMPSGVTPLGNAASEAYSGKESR